MGWETAVDVEVLERTTGDYPSDNITLRLPYSGEEGQPF
jgi:hypothetical protein